MFLLKPQRRRCTAPFSQAVRKKAIVAVHKFFKIVPEAVLDQKEGQSTSADSKQREA